MSIVIDNTKLLLSGLSSERLVFRLLEQGDFEHKSDWNIKNK